MNLFTQELKKLFKRRATVICIGLGVLLCLGGGLWNALSNLPYQLEHHYSMEQAGPGEVRQAKQNAEALQAELTGEVLYGYWQQYMRAWQPGSTAYDSYYGRMMPTQQAWEQYKAPIGGVAYWMEQVAQQAVDRENHWALATLSDAQAQDFWGLWRQARQNYLNGKLQGESEPVRAFYQGLERRIQTPFTYGFYEGWQCFIDQFGDHSAFLALFLCILAASLYAGEYQSGADAVLRCTRHGRGRLARAKLSAMLAFSTVFYLGGVALYYGTLMAAVGPVGWQCEIQLAWPFVSAVPLQMWQLAVLGVLHGLLCALAAVAFTALLSARMRTSFGAVVVGLLAFLLAVPVAGQAADALRWSGLLADGVIPALPNLTSMMDGGDSFRFGQAWALRGGVVWSPVLYLAMPVLLLAVCAPLAVRGYSRHEAC